MKLVVRQNEEHLFTLPADHIPQINSIMVLQDQQCLVSKVIYVYQEQINVPPRLDHIVVMIYGFDLTKKRITFHR